MKVGTVIEIERANLLGAGDENNIDPIAIVQEDDGEESWIPLTSNIEKGDRVGITSTTTTTYLGKGSKTTSRLIPLL